MIKKILKLIPTILLGFVIYLYASSVNSRLENIEQGFNKGVKHFMLKLYIKRNTVYLI